MRYTRVFDLDVIKWTSINFSRKNRLSFLMFSPYSSIQRVQRSLNLSMPSKQYDLSNPPKYPSVFHSTSSFCHTAISWGLGTDNSRWGPGLENTVDAEAIRNPIHVFLPVQCSMCEMMHCHHEEEFFSSSYVAVSS